MPLIYCNGPVCVRNVYAGIEGDWLSVRFDLVNQSGEVPFGEEMVFKGKVQLEMYLVDSHSGDIYLFGANVPKDSYICYTGNDIPEHYTYLASECTMVIPRSITQLRLYPNDRIKIRLPEFNNLFETVVLSNRMPTYLFQSSDTFQKPIQTPPGSTPVFPTLEATLPTSETAPEPTFAAPPTTVAPPRTLTPTPEATTSQQTTTTPSVTPQSQLQTGYPGSNVTFTVPQTTDYPSSNATNNPP